MTKRIAMWTGPRNISTTMMRSFENRPDCTVVDEPLYAHYLTQTGLKHPMQEEILSAQSSHWKTVIRDLIEDTPSEIYFQKHMCHHITDDMSLDWLEGMDHFFLIREPKRMIASYADRMDDVTPEGLGLQKEAELFDHISHLTGKTPAVLDANVTLADPEGVLRKLCAYLDIEFSEKMLSWPAGTRESDGVWAPHWYNSVNQSTGFKQQDNRNITLPSSLMPIVEACTPHYEHLYNHRLTAD